MAPVRGDGERGDHCEHGPGRQRGSGHGLRSRRGAHGPLAPSGAVPITAPSTLKLTVPLIAAASDAACARGVAVPDVTVAVRPRLLPNGSGFGVATSLVVVGVTTTTGVKLATTVQLAMTGWVVYVLPVSVPLQVPPTDAV